MTAAARLALPRGAPGIPAGPGRASRQRGAAAPRRRVTDLLLPAANRRRGRGRRDFIHSFIKKKRRSAAGKRALPGTPAPCGARILTAIRLVTVIRAVVVLVAFPDGGDAPLVPTLELVLLALLDGACETRGRAWVSGARSHGRAAGASRGRGQPGQDAGSRRRPSGGCDWARQDTAARCRTGAGLAGAQQLDVGLGEMRLRGSTAAIPKLLCAGIKEAIPVLPRIVLKAEGKGAWE